MTTMQEAIRLALADDVAFAALASGGVFDGETVGRRGMTRKLLTTDDVVRMQPGVYLTWVTNDPMGQAQQTIGAQNYFFDLYCYQDSGYLITGAMRKRAYEILNYTPVEFDDPADEIMRDIVWAGDVTGQRDDDMGGAAMERSSYQVIVSPKSI